MRYKVYQNGQLCKVMAKKNNSSMQYKVYMYKVTKPSKHREEIEAYLRSMQEPTLTVSSDGIATLTFTPIPEQMATWMAESKTIFFNVVRNDLGHARSRYNKYTTSRSATATFPYEWSYDVDNARTVSIPNTGFDRQNRIITKNELMQGSIVRNVEYIRYLSNGNCWGASRSHDNWYNEFFIGLIYFNEGSRPTLYKMGRYKYYVNQ